MKIFIHIWAKNLLMCYHQHLPVALNNYSMAF